MHSFFPYGNVGPEYTSLAYNAAARSLTHALKAQLLIYVVTFVVAMLA